MNITLSDLYTLPRACIIAIEHPKAKKVMLTISHGLFGSIERLIASNELSRFIGKSKLEEFNIRFFESINNRNILLVHLAYYENYYIKLGYVIENIKKPSIKRLKGLYYKVRVDIGVDGLVYVKLADKLNKQVIAGIFKTMGDALEFKAQYLDVQKVITPVIAYNSYTLEYYTEKISLKNGIDKAIVYWL